KEVIGSVKELEKKAKKIIPEVHKPEIDNIIWKCKCGGEMKRVSEVLDVWFDSGVSSWAALNYPQNEKLFRKFWPADLNIEGKDQFRGWWNSQLILSEIRFEKKPYENILVHGMILDIGKIKMSKSFGNIISPHKVIEKYGRDEMRYYFAKNSKGEDFAFDEKEFKEIHNFFRILNNVNNFVNKLETKKSTLKLEDKWILSRFNSFLEDVEKSYNRFRFPEVIQKLERFVIDDLSKTYIKIIRERENEVYNILNKIRNDLLVVLSPISPFITENIWQQLRKKKIVKEESVHLCRWPKGDKKMVNKKLESLFDEVFRIVEKGLAERNKAGIGLRWPLARADVTTSINLNSDLKKLIKNQLNVKKIELKRGKELKVNLDTKQTPELEAEGYARELSRKVQDFRKKIGLEKKDKIELYIITDDNFKNILEKQKSLIQNRTNSKKLKIVTTHKERFKNKIDFTIKDKRGKLAVIITSR
ncbi:MAG TPA: hypothetical protein ENI22_00975, partial [Candidatus Pacearchaeota archaeon]|nr:hypothetical protein [Candidatus Pacearchaeota archaeon]